MDIVPDGSTMVIIPAGRMSRAAWILLGLGLLFILLFHLVPGLLAGMLIFSLLHRLDRQLRQRRLATKRNARLLAMVILGTVGSLLAGGLGVFLVVAWKARATALPELLSRMAQVLDSTRTWLGNRWIPEGMGDANSLRETLSAYLHGHAASLHTAGGQAGRTLTHLAAGLVVGLLAAFHHPKPGGPAPLAAALSRCLTRFREAFEAIVFAQVRISAINALLTTLFLYVVLPIFGIRLPLRFTLVVVTLLVGMLPVLGNLLSNTAIVLISLGVGPHVALASLAFLILVHKLEYFLNARIVGASIQAQAWEVLLAMIVLDIAFGTPGLVLAPILYAYIKGELLDHGMV